LLPLSLLLLLLLLLLPPLLLDFVSVANRVFLVAQDSAI
jgi:hypothetical protein